MGCPLMQGYGLTETCAQATLMEMDEALVARTEAASASFFRAAGNVFDITTDAVIYDRERDGSFCTVTNVAEITGPLASEADAIAGAIAATE